VNRNHFATWAIMAIPLCLGLLAARRRTHDRHRAYDRLARIARIVDARTLWLATAGCVTTIALFLSRSRSGMIGLAAAIGFFWVVARARMPRRAGRWVGAYLVAMIVAVGIWAQPTAVISRFEETISGAPDTGDRWTIWRETIPAARDFWPTGTGAGTYPTAMLLYQQSYRSIVYFNQAHNHYLQVATEGGLLLLIPAAVALALFAQLARRRLREETTTMLWIRAGALAGMAAVAVQSIWETGLRMPANAILFAALAALAAHQDQLTRISEPPAGSSLRAVKETGRA